MKYTIFMATISLLLCTLHSVELRKAAVVSQDSLLEEFKRTFVQEVLHHHFFKLFIDLVQSKTSEDLRECFNENGGIFISPNYYERHPGGLMSTVSEFPLTCAVLEKIKLTEKK